MSDYSHVRKARKKILADSEANDDTEGFAGAIRPVLEEAQRRDREESGPDYRLPEQGMPPGSKGKYD